jgi:hypothetical protein
VVTYSDERVPLRGTGGFAMASRRKKKGGQRPAVKRDLDSFRGRLQAHRAAATNISQALYLSSAKRDGRVEETVATVYEGRTPVDLPGLTSEETDAVAWAIGTPLSERDRVATLGTIRTALVFGAHFAMLPIPERAKEEPLEVNPEEIAASVADVPSRSELRKDAALNPVETGHRLAEALAENGRLWRENERLKQKDAVAKLLREAGAA